MAETDKRSRRTQGGALILQRNQRGAGSVFGLKLTCRSPQKQRKNGRGAEDADAGAAAVRRRRIQKKSQK